MHQCGNYLDSPINIYAIGSSGYLALAGCRLSAFAILCAYNWRNSYLIKVNGGGSAVRGMVLPMYSEYFYYLLAIALIFGVMDIADFRRESNLAQLITIPLQMALEQCLFVTLAIFLTKYGAGVAAIRQALRYGLCWAVITEIIFFFIISFTLDYFDVARNIHTNDRNDITLALFVTYMAILILFYSILAFTPLTYKYRRPACIFYSKFNVLYLSYIVFICILLELGVTSTAFTCPCGILLIAIAAIIQPIVIFYTLQLDSQVRYVLSVFCIYINMYVHVYLYIHLLTLIIYIYCIYSIGKDYVLMIVTHLKRYGIK